MSDSVVAVLSGLGGVLLGAALGVVTSILMYKRQRKDVEVDARNAMVRLQHERSREAKEWLKNLPGWGSQLRNEERATQIREEAMQRLMACSTAWDNATGMVDDLTMGTAMSEVNHKVQAALSQIHSGNLNPNTKELEEALANFRRAARTQLKVGI